MDQCFGAAEQGKKLVNYMVKCVRMVTVGSLNSKATLCYSLLKLYLSSAG